MYATYKKEKDKMNNMMITNDAKKRLLRDVKQITTNPLNEHGIYYVQDDINMLKGYAMIVGPPNTPYFGGYYFFEFLFPYNYPYQPPIAKYCTNKNNIRFHPNLYENGKVCLSILNTWSGEQWSSCQTITTILLSLITLFDNNPLINEPDVTIIHPEVPIYNKIIEFANMDIAICDILFYLLRENTNNKDNTDKIIKTEETFTITHFNSLQEIEINEIISDDDDDDKQQKLHIIQNPIKIAEKNKKPNSGGGGGNIFPDFFHLFKSDVINRFIENKDKLLCICQELNKTNQGMAIQYSMQFYYRIHLLVDYTKIINKLKNCIQIVDSFNSGKEKETTET